MAQLKRNPKLAVAISRENARHYRSNANLQFYCFGKKEIIHEYYLKFHVCENFSYSKQLNEFIQMADASGLIEKWHTDYNVRSNCKSNRDFYHRIDVKNFAGLLIIWSGIIVLTICSLILEKIIHKNARKPNAYRLWTFFDKLIGPDRQFLLGKKYKK